MTSGATDHHTHNHALPPERMTDQCFVYYDTWTAATGFAVFVLGLVKYATELERKKHESLLDVYGRLAELSEGDEASRHRELQEQQRVILSDPSHFPDAEWPLYRPRMVRMLYASEVDNFSTYITDLLAAIFTTRPETLTSSKETVTHEFVLQYRDASMSELMAGIAEQRVDSLAMLGIENLASSLEAKHGIVLFEDADQLRNVNRIIETRNIVVHNRGRINGRFKRRVPESSQSIGDLVEITQTGLLDDSDYLARVVSSIDARCAAKFSLPLTHSRAEILEPSTRRLPADET